MRNSKLKVLRRIVAIVLIIALVILIDTGMNVLLSPVTYANYFNHEMAEIEKAGKKVDLIFCGASRTHMTFAPQVMEEKLNLGCVVNAATAGQPIRGTYYAVKDMIERFHPEQMVIGVVWNGLNGGNGMQGRLVVYDRLSLKNKFLMAVNSFTPEELPYVSAIYRFRDNFTFNQIRKNLARKNNLNDPDYENHYNGFVYRTGSIPNGNVKIDVNGAGFNPEKVKDANLECLDGMIEMCQKNGIKVTLVSGITSVMRMYGLKNYQGAVDFYTEYAKKHNVKYYNLNYLMDRETILPDEMMRDTNHTNGDGAMIATEKLAEVMAMEARGEDTSSCFYANLDEFKKSVHRIVAVKASIEADAQDPAVQHIRVTSLQNDDVQPVYRVLHRNTEEEEYRVVQDWTPETETSVRLEGEAGGTLRVEAGSADGTLGQAFQEYKLKAKAKEE